MRKKAYQIQTYYDPSKNLYIKQANEASKEHLMRMKENYIDLSEALKHHSNIYVAPPIYIDEHRLGFAPVDGIPFDELIGTGRTAYQAYNKAFWLIDILADTCGGDDKIIGAFDIVLSNLFRDQRTQTLSIIDYEWTSDIPLSTRYIKYRVLRDHVLRAGGSTHALLDICRYYKFGMIQTSIYERQECNFQKKVGQSRRCCLIGIVSHIFASIKYYTQK